MENVASSKYPFSSMYPFSVFSFSLFYYFFFFGKSADVHETCQLTYFFLAGVHGLSGRKKDFLFFEGGEEERQWGSEEAQEDVRMRARP